VPAGRELTVEESALAKILSSLSDREAGAYRYFLRAKQPELAAELSDELFVLFCQGRDCDEIRKVKPGLGLGPIVHARIRDKWDERLAEYQRGLVQKVPVLVQQTQLESAEFLTSVMAAGHMLVQKQIDDFMATGNKDHLKGTFLENMTLGQYQKVLEMLMKVTGQDSKKTINHTGGITIAPAKRVSGADAAAILDALELPAK